MASTLRASPSSERPAPRPVIRSTGWPSSTLATALEVVVLPMPISPVAIRQQPSAASSRARLIPLPMASTACSRRMAGPRVKSAVPAAMRQSRTPGTGSPAMPMSTGSTSQCAACAIRHTLVRRWARFSATARVTSCPVWLTPCATTPLSAQSTAATRREKSRSALPVRAAASSSIVSSAPSPPKGFARAAQWACAAARAASSGGVMPESKVFSSVSVICVSLFSLIVHRAAHKAAGQGCARPV